VKVELPPAVKVEPPPAPAIARIVPAEPGVGTALVIDLAAPGKPSLTYQYRAGPGDDWQAAPEGRVRLADLKPGPLTLEFRVLDRQGKPSSTVALGWDISPAPLKETVPAARFKVGDRFYQDLLVARTSTHQVLGLNTQHNAQYRIVSAFEVLKVAPDGALVVKQKVEGVYLFKADGLLQGHMQALAQQTRGATFTITVNARGEVMQVDGAPDAVAMQAGKLGGGADFFAVQSLLDRDGWKELAQLTFFKPRGPARKGQEWTRPTEHGWGQLGAWVGQVRYAFAGARGGQDHYAYRLEMKHVPPKAGAPGLAGQLGKSDFRLQAGGGQIVYDPVRGRVTAADEQFHVRGSIGLSVGGGGALSRIEMEEAQRFQLRILDRLPSP
jgi:hypothetical protein